MTVEYRDEGAAQLADSDRRLAGLAPVTLCAE